MSAKGSSSSSSKRTINSYFTKRFEENTANQFSHPPKLIEPVVEESSSKFRRVGSEEFDINFLERDPGLRPPIWTYPVNAVDNVRRRYISLGPNQPVLDEFPTTKDGKRNRRFQASWYVHSRWLEYSKAKDKAYCLPCFLFASKLTSNNVFSNDGFCAWKRVGGEKCALKHHVGGPDSHHNKALKDWESLSTPSAHIDKALNAQCSQEVYENRLRLRTSIDAAIWLARQGCAFRGHDESTSSSNRGNFIEKVKSLASVNEDIRRVVLENAPTFAKYTSPDIQKEILNIVANKVRNKIREEIGESKYCILVDESVDESSKEQMAIILRFINKEGIVLERFFEIVSVEETTASTLKREVTKVLNRFNLEVGNLRGQGYDGASNMRGQWNGLQALFLEECPYAYFVHCFAHRLQLALVAAANEVQVVWVFFGSLGAIVNVLTASAKRHSELKATRAVEITELLATGDLEGGQGANQTCTLQRAGATRWSSHYNEVVSYQMKELDRRFSDDMVDLLSLSSALDPTNHFQSFKIDDICTLATKFYPRDFTDVEFHDLRKELALYENDICSHPSFQRISSLSELCRVMYETRKNEVYFLVDRLIRLVLTLPVSTATTERAFSAMKIIKTRLRNKMEDEFLADNMVINIERDLAEDIDTDSVIQTFYAIKRRRSQLT